MRRISVMTVAVMAAVGFVVSGCIDHTTVVSVKKDGTGVVMETTYMSKAAMDMITQMAAGMGGGQAADPLGDMANPAKLRAKAANMGEGVQFVGAERVEKDGARGVKATYSFTDITKLKVTSEPDNPGGEAKQENDPVTFGFKKGAMPKLTVNLPFAPKAGEKADMPPPGEAPDMPAEQLQMMKQMFDGMRIKLMLKVDGDIKKTNAAHVMKGSESGLKQYVTLVDMDFGKMIEDPNVFKRLAAQGENQDMEQVMRNFQNVPGIKFETSPKIDIEFQ